MDSFKKDFQNEIKLGDNTYTYVWGDEFDGDCLDPEKWEWSVEKTGMVSLNEEEYIILNDERVLNVSDGKLRLISCVVEEKEDGSKQYASSASVHTAEKMSYLYGYCEIKAKVPFGKGLWPSFWACTEKSRSSKDRKYITEIDIFEVFGTDDGVVPNIHKWYDKNSYPYGEIYNWKYGNHTQYNNCHFCEDKNKTYFYAEHKKDISNLNNEFHTYGFEWTPTEMSMYVDGEKYMTYDIVNSYDECDDMRGFHEPLNIIFNNHLFVSTGDYIPDYIPGVPTLINGCEENLPSVYEIEYFRLYQNKSLKESKIYFKE